MKVLEIHWTLHPDKAKGLYYDNLGKPRSPWYDKEIQSKNMTPAAVARELDLCDELSVEGVIFPEFKRSHVYRGEVRINSEVPIIRVIDYGACCAALFMQKRSYGGINVFKEIVIEKGGSAPKLAKQIRDYSVELECAGFRDYDDPAGGYDGWVNDTTSAEVMRQYGINPTHNVSKASNQRRKDRVEMIHSKLMERVGDGEEFVQIHESCVTLIDAFESGYRHPEKTNGEVDVDLIEEIHPYEDVMDCFGMGLMEEFTVSSQRKVPSAHKTRQKPRNKYTGY